MLTNGTAYKCTAEKETEREGTKRNIRVRAENGSGDERRESIPPAYLAQFNPTLSLATRTKSDKGTVYLKPCFSSPDLLYAELLSILIMLNMFIT